jgi:hypothetical protein
MCALSQYYLLHSNPLAALELSETLLQQNGNALIPRIDAATACFLLNDSIRMVYHLESLKSTELYGSLIREFMPRIYYGAGLTDRFEKCGLTKDDTLLKYQLVWFMSEEEKRGTENQHAYIKSKKHG